MPEIAYVNGVFSAIADARVSIEDRGFQFGDGVYEVLISRGGKPFLLDRHLARLRQSLAGIKIEFEWEKHPLEPVIREGLRRCEFTEAMVYVQITRGAASRSHLPPANLTPTVVMTFKPVPVYSAELRARGLSLMTTPDIRWANCYIKAVTLLPNVLAKAEAARQGFDDVLFVSASGEVRESSTSNVFYFVKGRLRFPPRTHSVLHGVTQSFLIECAESIGLEPREEFVTVPSLQRADEVFLSATTFDVMPVTSVDRVPIAGGRPGPLTRQLYETFRACANSLP